MRKKELRIVTAGGIGDVILMTPAIRQWKHQNPAGRVVVHCRRPSDCDVLLGNPHVDRLHRSYRGIAHLLTWSSNYREWVWRRCISPDYFRYAPSYLGVHASVLIGTYFGVKVENTKPELFLSDSERQMARARLSAYTLPIAIHTIPASTQNKEWDKANWQGLVSKCSEFTFVQVGNKTEPLIEGAIDLRGLSLRDSFAAIGACVGFVGPDSAFAHAAAALSIPAVILFGPTNPAVWGHVTSTNVYTKAPCSPCIDLLYMGSCPYGRSCMTDIAVSEISEKLRNAVSIRPSPAAKQSTHAPSATQNGAISA